MSPPAAAAPALAALLARLLERTGADFRDWRAAALAPRLAAAAEAEGASGPEELWARAEERPELWPRIARALSRRPPAWFRDPGFFRLLRGRVLPLLKTYPSPRIWVPEEAGAEEAVALAVVLEEEGLLGRSRVYATAGAGAPRGERFEAEPLAAAAADFRRGGGRAGLETFFRFADGAALPRQALLERIVFGSHSLSTDASLNEFHLIVCRRALSDCNARLRERAHRLFWESLPPLGTLALAAGSAPSPGLAYRPLAAGSGLFQRAW